MAWLGRWSQLWLGQARSQVKSVSIGQARSTQEVVTGQARPHEVVHTQWTQAKPSQAKSSQCSQYRCAVTGQASQATPGSDLKPGGTNERPPAVSARRRGVKSPPQLTCGMESCSMWRDSCAKMSDALRSDLDSQQAGNRANALY